MKYFITGIDTDIGKTFITKGLALLFESEGKKVGVFKPVQSGAVKQQGKLIAPDLEAIRVLSNNIRTSYSYLLEGEVSPALAARLSGIKVDINKIKNDFNEFIKDNDVTLIEGAGGLMAPVSDDFLCSDLIKKLDVPIIIVTAPFLGRLNHTLLTIHYAKSVGLNIKGVIVNKVPESCDDLATKNFIDELKRYTNVEILGEIHDINCVNPDCIVDEFKKIRVAFS